MSVRKHETRVVYSCGHKAHVTLYGKSEEQERKRKWCEEQGICPSCYAEQMKQDRAALLAMRKDEYSLPDLEGSEKQIAWAEKIRNSGIDLLERYIAEGDAGIALAYPDQADQLIQHRHEGIELCREMFATVSEARFYIDNREGIYSPRWLVFASRSYEAMREVEAPDIPQEIRRDATMVPEHPAHGDAVEVIVESDQVRATYKKDDAFRSVVKKLHFEWDIEQRAWVRICSQFTGSATARAAELVNTLLRAGFIVMCADPSVRELAESAGYEQECRRWIKAAKGGGYVIQWDRDDKDFYRSAMELPGAKYRREAGGVVVPAVHWREIKDFAYIHDFKLSEKTQAIADAARDAEIPVKPAEPVIPEERDKLAEILQSSTEVLADLIG